MAQVPTGSAETLKRLNKALDQKQKAMLLYEQYYLGDHRLTFASTKFRETFGKLFAALAVNFCLLVVDAERERLNVEGFRFGADHDAEADTDAWQIWQQNKLDARSSVAHAEALTKGEAYVLVWGNPAKPTVPLIRVQDAKKVVVEYDDGDLDQRTVALKRWLDNDGYENATLYFPDKIEKYRSVNKAKGKLASERGADYWETRQPEGEDWPLKNDLGVVPMVPLLNNPLLSNEGRSELAAVIPIQDAINKLVADMLVSSEFVAYPQRWATGIEVKIDPVTKQPIEPFKAGAGRLWLADVVQGIDATVEPKFGQFPQANLDPYTSAIEMLVQQIASITKTPAHYLLGQSGSFPSGESLKATETGLVAKARGAMRYYGEAWEEVMRLAFQVKGDTGKATEEQVEVIWADPESRVMSEVTDAMGKQVAQLGVPKRIAWEKVGYSQVEIQRMEAMAQQEALQSGGEAVALLPAEAGPTAPASGLTPSRQRFEARRAAAAATPPATGPGVVIP